MVNFFLGHPVHTSWTELCPTLPWPHCGEYYERTISTFDQQWGVRCKVWGVRCEVLAVRGLTGDWTDRESREKEDRVYIYIQDYHNNIDWGRRLSPLDHHSLRLSAVISRAGGSWGMSKKERAFIINTINVSFTITLIGVLRPIWLKRKLKWQWL